eukprot:TRINITY_DN54_c0_g1_i1.p1 TRINITY_DN54_c0_g1~~TRINITY_DN54_c0_g1_i1.p1  ORF type:complete len:416 (+),score=103.93 TRINITY_DN54_c0_g1_i1:45-1250(+)
MQADFVDFVMVDEPEKQTAAAPQQAQIQQQQSPQTPTSDTAAKSNTVASEGKGFLYVHTPEQLGKLPVTILLPYDPKDDVKRRNIAELLSKKKLENNISLSDADSRNVILLGRARAGKSTVLGVMKKPTWIPDQLSLWAGTQVPLMHSFTVEYDKFNYNINIMDTPGMFEHNLGNKVVRSAEVIKGMITRCLELEVTLVHCFFFVCSFTAGINQDDINAVIELNKLFQGADSVFHLLITRSEGRTDRDHIERQVRSIPELAEFFANPSVKVFFSGALDRDDFLMGSVDTIEAKSRNILEMRDVLYKHIRDAKVPARLRDMKVFKDMQSDVDALYDQVNGLVEELETSPPDDAEQLKSKKNELSTLTLQMQAVFGTLARVTGSQQINAKIQELANRAEALYK